MANFQDAMEDVLGGQNPFENDSSDEGHGPQVNDEPDENMAPENPTLRALWVLQRDGGIGLAQLFDNILLGDPEISADKHVIAARTAIY
ncbi:hypothetical protein FRC11_002382, partial [Ceratobasidium sp. 423]